MTAHAGQSATTWARVAAGAAVSLVAATGIVGASPGPGDAEVTLTVLATNDITNQLVPPDEGDVGGLAHLATHLDAVRARAPDALYVDAGDLTGAGRGVARLFGGEPTVEAMNRLGLDVLAAGNHEFDAGLDHLRRLYGGGCVDDDCGYRHDASYEGAQFEALSANVIESASGDPVLPAWTLREVAGVEVGVVGLTSAVPEWPLATEGETTTTPIRDAVDPVVEEVVAAGAKVVVVVWHEGSRRDPLLGGSSDPNTCEDVRGSSWNLREQLPEEVDLVVDGHTHQAYVCDQPDRPLMTQALSHGKMYTETTLVYDPANEEVVRRGATNRWVTHDVSVDPEVDALVARYEGLASHAAPAWADLDGDGLGDGYEFFTANSDPRVADTDDDGLDDADEVLVHHTNPRYWDTDHGGAGDAVEVDVGTNPRLGVDDPLVDVLGHLGGVAPVLPVAGW